MAQEIIKTAWEKMAENLPFDDDPIPEELRKAWKRCKSYGVDPYRCIPSILSGDKFGTGRQAILENKLVQIATPLIESIFSFLNNDKFIIALSNKDGTLLDVSGEKYTKDSAFRGLFKRGYNWSEKTV